jgi:macrolide-specific efflux system membrane fusion protein
MIVEVDVPNPDDIFKAGMYASVTLSVQDADRASLPSPAGPFIRRRPDGPGGEASDNTIEERPVVVGMRTASLAEIRSGLSEGDLVVVGDRSGLAPGTAVSPKLVDSPAAE